MKKSSKPNKCKEVFADQDENSISTIRNLSIVVLAITEDKLKNILQENEAAIFARKTWATPLSVFLPLFLTRLTMVGSYHLLGFSSVFWKDVLNSGIFISVFFMIRSFINLYKFRKKGTVKWCVDKIKGG